MFDDYAHHPTEVRATLEAARTLGARRVVACFQPHLFSRTRMLAREFGEALALADLVAVVDVYPAREEAEDFPGVSGLTIARAAGGRRGRAPGAVDARRWRRRRRGSAARPARATWCSRSGQGTWIASPNCSPGAA